MPTRGEVYTDQLIALSGRTSDALARLWLWSLTQGPQDAAWVYAAAPVLEGAATAAVDLSGAYVGSVANDVLPASDLIPKAAAAHVWEPLEVLGSQLATGTSWDEASRAVLPIVQQVGVSTVMGAGRQATAEQYPVRTRWRRMVNFGACDWCLSLSGAEWSSGAEATFGHANCKCNALPVAEIADHNDRVLEAAGHDPAKPPSYRKIQQGTRLRKSIRTAERRQAEAAARVRSEVDPGRAELWSMREQNWETRAERAAERLRILETGSHLLPA
jgi:hypothetical protein